MALKGERECVEDVVALFAQRGEVTDREISPQRLVHYRDNWYLDAWCLCARACAACALEVVGSSELRAMVAETLRAVSPMGDVDITSVPQLGDHWHITRHGLNLKCYPVCYRVHRVVDKTLGIDSSEVFDFPGLAANLVPGGQTNCLIIRADGSREKIMLLARLDTATEVRYYRQEGILQYVLRQRLLHHGG